MVSFELSLGNERRGIDLDRPHTRAARLPQSAMTSAADTPMRPHPHVGVALGEAAVGRHLEHATLRGHEPGANEHQNLIFQE
jgi:hypothetical protein